MGGGLVASYGGVHVALLFLLIRLATPAEVRINGPDASVRFDNETGEEVARLTASEGWINTSALLEVHDVVVSVTGDSLAAMAAELREAKAQIAELQLTLSTLAPNRPPLMPPAPPPYLPPPPPRDWRVADTGEASVVYEGPGGAHSSSSRVLSAVVAHDGQSAYFGDLTRVRHIDLTTSPYTISEFLGSSSAGSSDGTGTSATFQSWIMDLCLSPDEVTMIIVDRSNSALRKVDMATAAVTTLASGQANIQSCEFRPDGASVLVMQTNAYAGGLDGILEVDVSSGSVSTLAGTNQRTRSDGIGTSAKFNRANGIALTSDGATAYIAEYGSNSLRKMDMQTLQVETVVAGTIGSGAHPIVLTPDDTTAIIGFDGGERIKAIDLTTGNYEMTSLASGITSINSICLAFTPDGSRLFVCDSYAPKLLEVV